MLSQKTIPGNFAAKYLKPDGQSKKTKQKLEESCSQVVFAIFIPAKLTQIWRTSSLRIAWRIMRMQHAQYFSHAISYHENVASARRVVFK